MAAGADRHEPQERCEERRRAKERQRAERERRIESKKIDASVSAAVAEFDAEAVKVTSRKFDNGCFDEHLRLALVELVDERLNLLPLRTGC